MSPGAKYAAAQTSSAIVTARKPKARAARIEGVTLTHPDRELWPGITKRTSRNTGRRWPTMRCRAWRTARSPSCAARRASTASISSRSTATARCPTASAPARRTAPPYLAIDDVHGLVAMAQMSAIELHAWGATEADPLHPDSWCSTSIPGEGVAFAEVVRAALDVRDRLQQLGLASFCRTTGGKGLHVVVPLVPEAGWDR